MLKRWLIAGALALAVCGVAWAQSISHIATAALANSLVVKAGPGSLYNVNCTSVAGNAAGYCVVINATVAPSTGAIVPVDFCYIANAGGCSLWHTGGPLNFSTGIVVLITTASSPYTYTTGTDTAAIGVDFN